MLNASSSLPEWAVEAKGALRLPTLRLAERGGRIKWLRENINGVLDISDKMQCNDRQALESAAAETREKKILWDHEIGGPQPCGPSAAAS
jgi:hypothetical protein